MNHHQMQDKLAERLAGRDGWEQHPKQPYHFRHVDAGVHIMVYATTVAVVFGPLEGQKFDKSVNASFTHFPALALDSMLEVAEALVAVRTAKRRAEAVEQQLLAGRMSG
jgi:hypothetical protein